MGRRSWIFLLDSYKTAEKVKNFCEKEDFLIFICHYVIIDGVLKTKSGTIYGSESKKIPALLMQTDGNLIVKEIVNQNIIRYSQVILLEKLAPEEIEDTGDGHKLKKAVYLSEKEFLEHLQNFNFN